LDSNLLVHDINTVNEEKKFERRLSLGISTTADFLIISSFCEQLILQILFTAGTICSIMHER